MIRSGFWQGLRVVDLSLSPILRATSPYALQEPR